MPAEPVGGALLHLVFAALFALDERGAGGGYGVESERGGEGAGALPRSEGEGVKRGPGHHIHVWCLLPSRSPPRGLA